MWGLIDIALEVDFIVVFINCTLSPLTIILQRNLQKLVYQKGFLQCKVVHVAYCRLSHL